MQWGCAWPAQLYAPLRAFTRDPALNLYLHNLGAYVCNPGKLLVIPPSMTSCASPATPRPPRLIFPFYFHIFNSSCFFQVIQPPGLGVNMRTGVHTQRSTPQHQQDIETLQNTPQTRRGCVPRGSTCPLPSSRKPVSYSPLNSISDKTKPGSESEFSLGTSS